MVYGEPRRLRKRVSTIRGVFLREGAGAASFGRSQLLLSRTLSGRCIACGSAGASPSRGRWCCVFWESAAPAEPNPLRPLHRMRLGGSLALPKAPRTTGVWKHTARREPRPPKGNHRAPVRCPPLRTTPLGFRQRLAFGCLCKRCLSSLKCFFRPRTSFQVELIFCLMVRQATAA